MKKKVVGWRCTFCKHHFIVTAGRKCQRNNRWIWLPDHQAAGWCKGKEEID